MNTFTSKTGVVTRVERFVQAPKLTEGYWWWEIGDKCYMEQVKPHAEKENLFGYGVKEFMAKQYR